VSRLVGFGILGPGFVVKTGGPGPKILMRQRLRFAGKGVRRGGFWDQAWGR
jgi:hypothetical protein